MDAPQQKNMLSMTANSYLPALILATAVFWMCSSPESVMDKALMVHLAFYALILGTGFFLLAINRTKPFFLLLWALVAYLGINNMQRVYGMGLEQLPQYFLLLFLLPLNALYFVMKPDRPLKTLQNFYLLCLALFQFALIENAGYLFKDLLTGFPLYVFQSLWLVILGIMLGYVSFKNLIKETGMFFAMAAVWIGIFAPLSAAVYNVSFAAAALIFFVSAIQDFISGYFKDPLTGVYSRNCYYIHARKSFPLKYSIGVICIDDYEKLRKVFGSNKLDLLTKMIIAKIQNAGTGAMIYRYNEDEFILVFKNEDIKQSYEYMETIRRMIAGAEFVLNAKKIVKVTISAGVSEKKRSDADVEAVLTRTREVLQKAYKFTQNITSKA